MLPVTGETLLSFTVIAVAVLATPGPSLLLIAGTSLAAGRRRGLLAVAGTATGLLVTVTLVVGGLGALATRFSGWFEPLRWLGVGWLAVLGARYLRTALPPATGQTAPGGFWTATAVSALNPSTTPFLVALLPQFVATDRPPLPQLATLGGAFLTLAVLIDCSVALVGSALSHRGPLPGAARWQRRLTGGLLLVAAMLLALAAWG